MFCGKIIAKFNIALIFFSSVLLYSMPGFAQDLMTKDGLFSLQGGWTGRGVSVISDRPEKVACRAVANPKKERLEVVISCNSTGGSGRLVAYIGLDDSTRAISGVWHQAFKGKQGQTRGKLTGTAKDKSTLAMLLNTYGKDRASVLFNLVSQNEMRIKVAEIENAGNATFDVMFKRQ